jgi:hypothetical protein
VDDLELFSIRGEEGSRENAVEEGDRLPLVPAHTLSAGGDVQLPAGLEAGVEIRHVGRRWLRGDEANVEEPLDPYTATDLRAAWSSAGWTVRAHLGNVFQESRAACA